MAVDSEREEWGGGKGGNSDRVVTHHAAGRQTHGFLTHTSITPLSTKLEHPESGVQKVLLWAGEACGGRPVYKREGGDMWIEYWSASRQWQVKNEASKGEDKAMMYSHAATEAGAVEAHASCNWLRNRGT